MNNSYTKNINVFFLITGIYVYLSLSIKILTASNQLSYNETEKLFETNYIHLTVNAIGSSTIDVGWLPVLDINNKSMNYLVSYSNHQTSEIINTSTTRLKLNDLIECTTYIITVRCIFITDDKIVLGPSTTKAVSTLSIIQTETINNFSVSVYSRAAILSWNNFLEKSTCSINYRISWSRSQETHLKEQLFTENNFYYMNNLEPCTQYTGYIIPVDRIVDKGKSTRFNFTTKHEITGTVENLSYVTNEPRSLFLSWNAPKNFPLCVNFFRIVYCGNNFDCSSLNTQNNHIKLTQLKPKTSYIILVFPVMLNNEDGIPARIVATTETETPEVPLNLSVIFVSPTSMLVQWASYSSNRNIIAYRLSVRFKNYVYEVPKYCSFKNQDQWTYNINVEQNSDEFEDKFKNTGLKEFRYEIKNDFKPASEYQIELFAITDYEYGNSSATTIITAPSSSSQVVDLKVLSITSNSVTISWKHPCEPNGRIAFFHSTTIGERYAYDSHIFGIKYDIMGNKKTYEYNVTNLLPAYNYRFTVAAITYDVEVVGQDNSILFTTLSTSPNLPSKYDTHRYLRVTVYENYLTRVRVNISTKLFSNLNGTIRSYSIIVLQDGGFPDIPERGERNDQDKWPPELKTWAMAAPYPFILAYQTTPNGWMPFNVLDQTDDQAIFDIGVDDSCHISDVNIYCNGPLRPGTNYRMKLRVFTDHGFQDSWTVPFTTPGKYTTIYYLILCSVLLAILITTTGICCVLNKKVPWTVRKTIQRSDDNSKLSSVMSYQELLDKNPQQIEAEFNILTMHMKPIASMDIALMPQNKSKNRYTNILPYDYNRVAINSNDGNYINASLIEDSKGILQYIASQGPTKNTCADMWQMILDFDISAIVMLCHITEQGKIKCEKYFPDNQEKLVFGNIYVNNDIMIVDNEHSYTTRIITIKKEDKEKTIRHFQFHNWPDFGVPSEPSVMVKFCQIVQAKAPAGIIVVHCSAGIGRTGTYIACDILLRQIHEKSKLDVLKTVLKLRKLRANMVQTQAQYEFVYSCLAFYIRQYLMPTSDNTVNNKRKSSRTNTSNNSSGFT
ncbi:tyrosine-protein phosphatase 10D-like isoform X3 [Daktulosphaira vitifoliae]|uniref:tyrosine-protein phosphatase 10D-like isoform X3 n=1 Tax=Daktulosphaira vitifoliae TaxID=58002 RepID=UPI0021AA8CA0|nr:tyrosine-protein phosphatase 10D-like isoform X3 [Daktulosphaira vitifoliae]